MVTYKDYKTILTRENRMNVYRGCTHGCIYCDSRSEVYGMTYTFENIQSFPSLVKNGPRV